MPNVKHTRESDEVMRIHFSSKGTGNIESIVSEADNTEKNNDQKHMTKFTQKYFPMSSLSSNVTQ